MILDPPVLVRVTEMVWLVPICTLPKLMLAGVALSEPVSGVCVLWELDLPVLTPWQPSIKARASTTASAFQRVGKWPICD